MIVFEILSNKLEACNMDQIEALEALEFLNILYHFGFRELSGLGKRGLL
tara:strand:+ start:1967 stop:2113 length:147 start_codon:yes stop_codon:yes gene_type:complete